MYFFFFFLNNHIGLLFRQLYLEILNSPYKKLIELFFSNLICVSQSQAYEACQQHYGGLDVNGTQCTTKPLSLQNDEGQTSWKQKTVASCVFEYNQSYETAISYGNTSGGHLIWSRTPESNGIFYPTKHAKNPTTVWNIFSTQ